MSRESSTRDKRFSDPANDALEERLEHLRSWLIDKAVEIAEKTPSEKQPYSAMCVLEAARLLPPGVEFRPPQRDIPPSFWSRVLESITGITLISAVLALAFGILGSIKAASNASAAAGWLDIAKVFAGAIVGSAGVATSAAIRGRSAKG